MSSIFSGPPKPPQPDTSAQQAAEARAKEQEKKLDEETRSRTGNLTGRNKGRGLLINKATGEAGVSETLG